MMVGHQAETLVKTNQRTRLVMIEREPIYRYERKFLVDELGSSHVRALVKLHPAMFFRPYPPRYVNNIYFDTPDMDYYDENVSGVKDRRKVRIRWYGDLFGPIEKPVLEFKIKDGFVGTKQTHPFPPFALDERFDQVYFQQVIKRGELPQTIQYYLRDLEPVLVNRYYRWYYATMDGRFRVTVDTEMSFLNIRRLHNPFRFHHRDHHNIVVELKYDVEHDADADRVSRRFPFSLTKNSKYVQGIERVFL